ncbi:hypothetical protein PIB30_079137 [Stylosanthes scabra]|uniref:DYW domain-containing protein n=1 Tax=Stylosanthes scabra TaxID=79078 RepID=A0ABU6ZPN6_9FABA|nr:hypothetical protein [Stylosanthes scabra]
MLVPQAVLSQARHNPSLAQALHSHLIKCGLHDLHPYSASLIDSYAKSRLPHHALLLFLSLPLPPHPVAWSSALSACNLSSNPRLSLSLSLPILRSHPSLPDHFVFATLFNSFASLAPLHLSLAKQLHARFLFSPFSHDDVVKSSLVDMYSKFSLPLYARAVFDSISSFNKASWTAMISGYARNGFKNEALKLFRVAPNRDLFAWTALISGLVQSGKGVDALQLFVKMLREGVEILDPLVLSSVVGACANCALLELGKQCSDLDAAKGVFLGILRKDVVSWTSIIVGSAQHGRAEEALALYDGMVSAGVKPNEVTFVGLMYACSHVGLVGKGRELFRSMVEDHGIRPSLQHYTCLLDLLGRSGHLEEAENLVRTMPVTPDEPTWAALLSACKHHGNAKMAIRIADNLLSLKPEEPSSYILLSNVYAGASMWENVSKVRKMMMLMDVKKEPGYSCIELGKESYVFYAGETSHPMKDEIAALMRKLDEEMRKRGYVPDTSSVLHDMDQQEKERQLFWHSERLALAYGLLKSVPGTIIRIVKNLRVCGDCHTVLKIISTITSREIYVRDTTSCLQNCDPYDGHYELRLLQVKFSICNLMPVLLEL